MLASDSVLARRGAATLAPAELSRIEPAEILHSSDGKLSVWNFRASGECGGTMPDISVTFRWSDPESACTTRDWTLSSGKDSQVWVEHVAVLRAGGRTVYVVIGEGKWTTHDYSMELVAYEIRAGAHGLERVAGFFPALPGTSEDLASIRWEYQRERGDAVYPRPFEVRAEEASGQLKVYVFPRQSSWSSRWRVPPENAAITLSLHGDRMVSRDFGAAARRAVQGSTMAEDDTRQAD